MIIWPKKVLLFPEIGQVKIFLSPTHPHIRMCIRIYIFVLKNTHTQTKKKAKKTKEKRKKETREEKEKQNAVVVNSIYGKYDLIR